ncbi:MAG: fumarylacetoacetate hydrolase family protein [Deltaproteobacteria bacterium]|nr:fumarylacetoacetate hydrolase family protein [Deltaproteobacteria bacterium]
MRYATIQHQGSSHFALSKDGAKWFLWQDYAKQFATDKVVSQTQNFLDFVKRSDALVDHLKKNEASLAKLSTFSVKDTDFLLPFIPVTFRDFYCFEEHVMAARKGRGLEMIPEWYQAPIFYYSNHLSFRGPNEVVAYPKDSTQMDCELELACVIGKEIRNATLEQARAAIFGYSILNDWTARDFQAFEMKINMGPTKGKDFCTTFGSQIVSADELGAAKAKGFDKEIELTINGEVFTKKNWSGIQFSFEEMIVRASKNCTIYPGEVFGSGTMGGGCLLEHNLGKDTKRWLKIGDTVGMKWLPSHSTSTSEPFVLNKIGEPV